MAPSRSAQPHYRRMVDVIAAKIDAGELNPGDQIPSTAQLGEEFGVSATVVNQAVLILQSRGFVYGVPGVGRFVSDRGAK